MTGTLTAVAPTAPYTDVLYAVAGSGTPADGHIVSGITFVGPDGLPGLLRSSSNRSTVVLHRSGITAQDKVATLAAASVTATGQTGGSLSTSTTYFWEVIPGNKHGTAGIPASAGVGSTGTSTNTAVRLAWAQVTGAEYYDLFLSTDAAPKYVGRVTEAQRATGGLLTVASTGSAGATIGAGGTAGAIDVRVAGTGQQTSATPFANNNAWTPELVEANSGAITTTGYGNFVTQFVCTLTDLFTAPALKAAVFCWDDNDSFYTFRTQVALSLLANDGSPLRAEAGWTITGPTKVVVCLAGFAGNGLSVNVAVQAA